MKSMAQTRLVSRKKPRVIDALKQVGMFKGLSEKQIKKLAKKAYIRHYGDKELVFYKDEPAYGIFVVMKGTVHIKEGKREIITYRRLSAFGEFALLKDATRAADAITKGETTLCYFFKEDLRKLFHADPRMCAVVYQNLLATAMDMLKRT